MICNILLSFILLCPMFYCIVNKSNFQESTLNKSTSIWTVTTSVITDLEIISITIADFNIATTNSTNCTVYHFTWAFILA